MAVVGCYETRNTMYDSRNINEGGNYSWNARMWESRQDTGKGQMGSAVDMVKYFQVKQKWRIVCHSHVVCSPASCSGDAQLSCPKFVVFLSISKLRCQWRILILRSGLAQRHIMRHYTVPLDLTSGSGFATSLRYTSDVFYRHPCTFSRQFVIDLSSAIRRKMF